jgi:hypothetical protein
MEALSVHRDQGIVGTPPVPASRRIMLCAAKRIGRQHDAKAEVERSRYGRHDAYVGFAAGDDQRLDSPPSQASDEAGV